MVDSDSAAGCVAGCVAGMNLGEGCDEDVGINLCGFQAGVSCSNNKVLF